MGHTTYGYRIQNGIPVINEEKADQVRRLFEGYTEGMGLIEVAESAGIHVTHAQVKRMLTNRRYLGTEEYPQIITEEQLEKAERTLHDRAVRLGRIREPKAADPEEKAEARFFLGTIAELYTDPYRQAEYAYSLITEVKENG